MLVTRDNFTQFLNDSNLGFFTHYAAWSNGAYTTSKGETGPMELAITIMSILQVILNILVIVVLITNGIKREVKIKNFHFIVNVAATDIIGFILMIWCLEIQKDSWSYKSFDPEIFTEKMTAGCQTQMALIMFSYQNSVFATIFLTLDRFLVIYKPFEYELIMTQVGLFKWCQICTYST